MKKLPITNPLLSLLFAVSIFIPTSFSMAQPTGAEATIAPIGLGYWREDIAVKEAIIHGSNGQASERSGNYSAALAEYQNAVSRLSTLVDYSPNNSKYLKSPFSVYWVLGSARLDMARMWALMEQQRDLTSDEQFRFAVNLSLGRADLGKALALDQAIASQMGTTVTPNTWMIYNNLGWLYLLQGNVTESGKRFQVAQQLNPQYSQMAVVNNAITKVDNINLKMPNTANQKEKFAAYAKVLAEALKLLPRYGNFFSAAVEAIRITNQ